ncbi:MAG: hypothetical protein H8D47_05185 [Planctomycetes bacterium]|nr:hypothetical protein [Planctomycetota bacterium]
MKSKRVWAARLLALLVMSFGLSLLVSIDSANKMPYTKRIEIKANNNVEEIINAVENLGRDDLYITTKDKGWYIKKPIFLWVGMGLFVSFGFFLGIYYVIYCCINGLLNPMTREDNLLKPTS